MLGIEIPGNREIGSRGWVKSSALVLHGYGHSFARFTSATNPNQFAGIETVTVEDCIVKSFSKSESHTGHLAENAVRFFDHAGQPVYHWGNGFDFTRHLGINFKAGGIVVRSYEVSLQTR